MTLLQEIQRDAVSNSADLASVLRKCRILAQRLKNEDFKNWVVCELDGYPSQEVVPGYRTIRCQSIGHFSGYFGRELRNAQIPTTAIPKEFRDHLSQHVFAEGVSTLQELIRNQNDGALRFLWPAEAYQIMGANIYEDMHLVQAFKLVNTSRIAGILDTVRNKILNFVLEIEAQNPQAGEAVTVESPVPIERVQQIFNTNIAGDVANLALGSTGFSQHATVQVVKGDFASLERAIQSVGADGSDLSELKDAIKSDPEPTGNTFGAKVGKWIGKMVTKAAGGALKVTTDVAASVITEALKKYYGLPH